MTIRRFTRTTKAQLVALIDFLGRGGHATATQTLMDKLAISHEELAAWRDAIVLEVAAGRFSGAGVAP